MAFRFWRRRGDGQPVDGARRDELETLARVRAQYPPGTRLHFGAPTRCPSCGDFGLVEHVDERAGQAENRCLRCGAAWTISRRALSAGEGRRRPGSEAPLATAGPGGVGGPVSSVPSPAGAPGTTEGGAPGEPGPEVPGVLFTRAADGRVVRRPVTAGGAPSPRALDEAEPVSRRPLPLRVLLVEDNPDDVEIVRALLQPVGEGTIDLRTAATRRAGEAVARSTPPDLVLLDLGLPDSSGLSTVTAWHREVHDDAPVLVVSGACEPEVRDRRRELGVVDVVDKSELVHFLELGDRGSLAFVDRLSAAAAP